jgi:hypothetical protein
MNVWTRPRRLALFLGVCVLAADGRALAQTDLTGEWRALFHEDIAQRLDNPAAGGPGTPSGAGGPRIGDYMGLPINDAARLRADSWDPRIVEAKEHQTIAHPGPYWILGAGGMRFSTIIDDDTQALVAIRIYRAAPPGSSTRIVWMDGRPHPPDYAAHTWWGFSTGTWSGNTLVVTTTHLKAGWIRRNGIPSSDHATMTEYFVRHGTVLTLTRVLDDAIYLEEPLVTTLSWVLDPEQHLTAPNTGGIVEFPGRPDAFVPHFLPGANPYLHETSERFGIPYEATRGGRETMYPEYARKLRELQAAHEKPTTR